MHILEEVPAHWTLKYQATILQFQLFMEYYWKYFSCQGRYIEGLLDNPYDFDLRCDRKIQDKI